MNRVSTAIDTVTERLNDLSPAKIKSLEVINVLEFSEHFQYQEKQAQAHASGKLSTEEANILYVALGEIGADSNGGWAEGTNLATKIVVTMVIGELLGVVHE